MEVSANVRRTEPTPRREQDGETYSAATRSRSTSTQPIAAPSMATHTSCSRIARATRSAAPRVAHLSACSLDIAGTASARMARRRILASASSSAASARRICIKSLPRGLTLRIRRGGRTPTARHRSRARAPAVAWIRKLGAIPLPPASGIAPAGLVGRRRQAPPSLTTQALHVRVMLLEPRDVRSVRLNVVGEEPQELSRVLRLRSERLEGCGGHLIGHFSVP